MKRNNLVFLFTVLVFPFFQKNTLAQNLLPVAEQARLFYDQHDRFKEALIQDRRFKHADIQAVVKKLKPEDGFTVKEVGRSIGGKEIYLVKIGNGSKKVLMWSQMHGNEPTATMALADIFAFFSQKNEFEEWKKHILNDLTLYFIPMLNPDGADLFVRRNAVGIDLNRDASRLQCPESQTLKAVRDSLKPDFGFNLHDQGRNHSAGYKGFPATMSFLAPAYDYKKSINETRGNAILLISELHSLVSNYIPNQIGRYYDSFEPRAFGDNIQKWGTSTILIESGGYKGDWEKQTIRKLNFMTLLAAMQSISQKNYLKYNQSQYFNIPQNGSSMVELKLKNLKVRDYGREFLVDVIYDRNEQNYEQDKKFYFQSRITEVGELFMYHGYDELDCTGMTAEMGKVYPETLRSYEEVKQLNFKDLYEKGYTAVRLKVWEGKPENYLELRDLATDLPKFSPYPIHILFNEAEHEEHLQTEQNPSIVIRQNGKVRFVVINGFICDLEKEKPEKVIPNGLIFR